MSYPVLTIGHSNHTIESFLALLHQHDIGALADVRSQPYSRHFPQFSREALRDSLTIAGVRYVFLGKELGARSENHACYRNGRVQFDRLAKEPLFLRGIERLERGAVEFRVALMCAEKDPLDCHRAMLVARQVAMLGLNVSHILADGSLETQDSLEQRLLAKWHLAEGDLLLSRDECLDVAYRQQGERIGWADESMAEKEMAVAA